MTDLIILNPIILKVLISFLFSYGTKVFNNYEHLMQSIKIACIT